MDDINFIDYLSLRASYGTNGNQSIDPYASLATIATSEYQFFGPTSHTLTQFIDRLANDDLGWESTTGLNLGMDFSVLKNRRLRGSSLANISSITDTLQLNCSHSVYILRAILIQTAFRWLLLVNGNTVMVTLSF